MKKYIYFLMLFSVIYTFAFEQSGKASWYGPDFHGKKTANGEIFNTNDFTAAHKTLPFGSIVKISSLENDKFTIARINDRGPFVGTRVIDLSKACAEEINMIKPGVMNVKIELLEKGDNIYHKFIYNKKYFIQVASFSDKLRAENLYQDLIKNNFNIIIKEVLINNQNYFRIIINDLTYYTVQEYRVKLHKQGLVNYRIYAG